MFHVIQRLTPHAALGLSTGLVFTPTTIWDAIRILILICAASLFLSRVQGFMDHMERKQ